MTHFEYYRKTLEEIQKEKPDMEEIATFFLGAIASHTVAILDILEEMKNGNKL